MMEEIKSYFLTVTAAAILCAVIQNLAGKHSGLVKLICGLFLAFAVIGPVARFRFDNLLQTWENLSLDAREAVAAGEAYSREARSAVIKADTEAYIMDRASSLGLSLAVTVSLSEGEDSVPTQVTLQGPASPYAKQRLQQILAQELNIGKEHQLWIP